MNRIAELRQRRAKLWLEAKKYLDEHRDDDGELGAECSVVYEKMVADVIGLGHEIERLEEQAHIDTEVLKDSMRDTLCEEVNRQVTVRDALGEARKILFECDSLLAEMERNVCGDISSDCPPKKEPDCMLDEATFIPAMAYNVLQKVKRINTTLFNG